MLFRIPLTLLFLIHQLHGFVIPSFIERSNLLRSAASSSSDDNDSITLFSPCKINLFLRIIRKREDGFHDLASLFQAIGFGDTLELTKIDGPEDDFTCNMPGVPTDSTNLVLRAISLMRDKIGGDLSQSFRANLIKQCPAQAGLGGGSANAATAMWGVNELLGRPATVEQVCRFLGKQVRVMCLIFGARRWWSGRESWVQTLPFF